MAGEPLDVATETLIRFAVAVAGGRDPELRQTAAALIEHEVPAAWVDELVLQSVLMVGWPRALVAMGMWRGVSGVPAPAEDEDADYGRAHEWDARGEATCRVVYGDNYDQLRANVQRLHPALDMWMVAEGYGRTLSRPGLDLVRRELCTVVQTAVLNTPHQLHSHLRGALNAGATDAEIDAALQTLGPHLTRDHWNGVKQLWGEIRDRNGTDAD
jgi:4-carboxymuconolactone decarboxylase